MPKPKPVDVSICIEDPYIDIETYGVRSFFNRLRYNPDGSRIRYLTARFIPEGRNRPKRITEPLTQDVETSLSNLASQLAAELSFQKEWENIRLWDALDLSSSNSSEPNRCINNYPTMRREAKQLFLDHYHEAAEQIKRMPACSMFRKKAQ